MYLVYLTVILFSLYYINHKFTKGSNIFLIGMWFVVFIVMGTYGYFSDDFEAYEDIIMDAYANPLGNFHLENVWLVLAEWCKGDVIQFRFISFIALAILLFLLCRQFKVPLKYFVCYYSLICMGGHICWIRQPVAMGIFLLGLGMILNKHIWLGVPILLVAFFFHKMAFVFIGMVVFMLIPIKRSTIWLYLIFCISTFAGFTVLLKLDLPYSAFLLLYLESDGEFESRNIIFTILSFLALICQICINIGSIYKFRDSNQKNIRYLVRYLLGLLMLAIGLIAVPFESGVLVKRVLALASMVNVIILAKGLKSKLYYVNSLSISLPLILSCILGNMYTIGNNYTRLERLLRIK